MAVMCVCLFFDHHSNLLAMVKDQDLNQMRHVFNSIDVDNDGHLSLSEMRKFAREVRYIR